MSLGLCTPCMLHPREADRQSPPYPREIRKNRVASVSSELLCPVTCSPFPSVAIPLCTCNDGPCPSFETREVETQEESPRHSHPNPGVDQDKMEGPRLERTSCSSMFWSRRSCSREHQCNSEINAWLASDGWIGRWCQLSTLGFWWWQSRVQYVLCLIDPFCPRFWKFVYKPMFACSFWLRKLSGGLGCCSSLIIFWVALYYILEMDGKFLLFGIGTGCSWMYKPNKQNYPHLSLIKYTSW